LHTFKHLTKALVLAAVVLLGHPDTARAQLFFTPNPVPFTISGPGGTAGPTSVSVSANTQITSLSVSNINTASGGNWLCAIPSGTTTVNVYIGSGNCSVAATTTQLAANQNYTGTIVVQGNGGTLSGTINVTLGVGTTGGGSGVAAFPSSITFNATPNGQVNSQSVQVTYNGSPQQITSATFTPTSGVSFLNPTFSGSTATFFVTSTNFSNGTYNGTVALGTIFGTVNVQVSLTISSSGSSGVVASPSSVNFFAAQNGQVGTQTVSVTVNGAATSINGFSFTPTSGGVSFITPTVNGSVATLTVNTTNLTNGVYTGTLQLGTFAGSVNVQVTLTIGSGASIVATPNPVTFTMQTGGPNPTPQNVLLTSNGVPISTNQAPTTATNDGLLWLKADLSATPGTVIVSINGTQLSPGSYTGTVTLVTAQGTASFQVNLTVGGASTLQVNPTVLNFAYQVGTSIPLPQNVSITSSGSAITYSVSSSISSGNTPWLVVSPQGQGQTPGTLTVSVQPAGLQAGSSYVGNIQLTPFVGASTVVNIQVNLLVSNSPVLSVSPSSLTFTAQQGSTPANQILTLQSSSSQLNFNVSSSVSTPAGFNWLQVPTQFGSTPGSIPVSVTTSGLGPGTYNGTVSITSQNAGNPSISVPITLVITSGSVLTLSPGALSFAYQIGQSQPQSQTVNVGSPGGQVGFTVASQTNSGGNWLSVSSTTGVAPGSFSVGVTTTGLTAGTYTATLTVTPTSGAAQTMQVTLVVSTTALLVATPSTVTFTAQPATGTTSATVSPSFQNLAITSTDGTQISFGVAVTYSTGGAGWLFVNTSTGVTPSNLSITASPANLGIGRYTATVTLTATSPTTVANSPQTISVIMTVGTNATLTSSPGSLSFSQNVNGAAPAAQTLSISSGSSAVNFSASATTSQGAWLSVSPTSGITPASLTVSANGAGLGAGTYTGQIVLTAAGVAQTTVTVTLTISSGGVGSTGAGSMAHLASAGLWKTIFTLVNNGTVTSQARLNFFDDNGNPLALPLTFPQASPFPQAPVAFIDRTLSPGATLIIESTGPDNQAVQTGWAQLVTSGAINGFAVFRQTVPSGQHEAVVPLETRNPASFVLAFDNTSGFVTGVAMANTAAQSAFVQVIIRDDNGVVIQSNSVALAALGHTSFDLAARFPVAAARRGTVEFQTPAGGGISVLGIRFNPAGTFSTVPAMAK
jgi:hypothetical protein